MPALGKPSRERGTVLLGVLFVIYLVLLTWIVLWKLEVPFVGGGALRRIKLVPFAPSGGAGASGPFEVAANVMLFVPLGLYLGLLAPSWPWWRSVGAVAGVSLVLEVAQYVLAVGSSDVTDLGVNVVGGLAGIGLLALARRRLQARTITAMTRVCSIGTVLAVLAIVVFVASPLRYRPRTHAGRAGTNLTMRLGMVAKGTDQPRCTTPRWTHNLSAGRMGTSHRDIRRDCCT